MGALVIHNRNLPGPTIAAYFLLHTLGISLAKSVLFRLPPEYGVGI